MCCSPQRAVCRRHAVQIVATWGVNVHRLAAATMTARPLVLFSLHAFFLALVCCPRVGYLRSISPIRLWCLLMDVSCSHCTPWSDSAPNAPYSWSFLQEFLKSPELAHRELDIARIGKKPLIWPQMSRLILATSSTPMLRTTFTVNRCSTTTMAPPFSTCLSHSACIFFKTSHLHPCPIDHLILCCLAPHPRPAPAPFFRSSGFTFPPPLPTILIVL